MRARAGVALGATLAGFGAALAGAAEAPAIEEVVVSIAASIAPTQRAVGSATALDADEVALVRANHPQELLARVPGTWIARGSGQEHLTAIRSGVLTGAGACGEFLLLENGIPIRPAGFCNVNNLFELNTEQAAAVEVVRGPASALFGGNALHGVVNVVTAAQGGGSMASVEAGPYGYRQARLGAGGGRWRLDALSTGADGYRDDTGYGQHKATAGLASTFAGWEAATTVAATLLNQETGGYVRGADAYRTSLRRTNPNPEAYRDAWSARGSTVLRRTVAGRELAVAPYWRRSAMAFRQHFLPGTPLERNAQTSGGVLAKLTHEGERRWQAGLLAEWLRASLSERQRDPTIGSAFLMATRPPGTHYDYLVEGSTVAAFFDFAAPGGDAVEWVASGRAERTRYRYDNRHLDGNTRDDGTLCGFGGCLYTRPADRADSYRNFAGRLGFNVAASANNRFYVVAGQGFRPPQTTELYRLQRGQTVAALKSEAVQSVEAGARGSAGRWDYRLALYADRTRNLIFRDANGFNVSDGATRSRGAELDLRWTAAAHAIELVASYAAHRYAFTRTVARGERIADGNAVDTAPRWLASARWRWRQGRADSEFEIARVGAHYIDAANTARYGGHTLAHWRGAWQATPRIRLFARLLNLFDAAYAERADFAFGSYRYFPGQPRRAYLGIEARLRGE